ncbi:MAG TPA: hypothetical protein VH309_14390 [Elusimicrobiota bacterium]|jgi:hypothetical protein|nr:hypothetical protein [Elusimicrobiota bacterium]
MAKKISAAKTPRPAATVAAVRKAAPKKPALLVSIDYPADGEAVRSGHYSIRLAADGASEAQCRVDGGDWLACREAVGHFWLDWAPSAGEARLEARARSGKGRWTAAPARAVAVAG